MSFTSKMGIIISTPPASNVPCEYREQTLSLHFFWRETSALLPMFLPLFILPLAAPSKEVKVLIWQCRTLTEAWYTSGPKHLYPHVVILACRELIWVRFSSQEGQISVASFEDQAFLSIEE